MNRSTLGRFSRRAGFVLIAIGLSIVFVLIALQTTTFSYGTVPIVNGGGIVQYGQSYNPPISLPARSFTPYVCCDAYYATPQQRFQLFLGGNTQSVMAYILKTNSTNFSKQYGSWLNITYGGTLPAYDRQNVTLLNRYLSSHRDQIAANFTVQPSNERPLVYFPTYVGSLLVILANTHGATLNVTVSFEVQGINVPPGGGTDTVVGLLVGGVALLVIGFATERGRTTSLPSWP